MSALARPILLALLFGLVSGCALKERAAAPSPERAAAPGLEQEVQTPQTQAIDALPASQPLPFKGRLFDGNPAELPQTIALSLAPDSPITFSYREEITHDDYHIPLIISALDPVTYVGAPLGDFGVTVSATLTIFDRDRVIGDYAAKTHVSRSYTLYHEPTHHQVEEEARTAVREKIDAKIERDRARLAKAVGQPAESEPPNRQK